MSTSLSGIASQFDFVVLLGCSVTVLQVSKRDDAWPQSRSFNPVISRGAERCKPTDFERLDARFLDTHP